VFRHIFSFYRAARMHSADYAVARYLSVDLSVRPSVCHMPIFCRNGHAYPQTFPPSGSHNIPVFRTEQYAVILTGRRMQGGMKKSRFSANISLYLRNDTRYGYCYYGMRIAFNDLKSPLIQISRSQYSSTSITRKWYNIELYLQRQTNGSRIIVYRTVPLSSTLNDL